MLVDLTDKEINYVRLVIAQEIYWDMLVKVNGCDLKELNKKLCAVHVTHTEIV